MDPLTPAQVQTPPISNPVPVEKPKNNSVLIILSLFLVILVGLVAFLGYQNYQLQKQISLLTTPTPTASAIALATADPTANWNTFTTDLFSLKYPNDWNVPVKSTDSSGDTSYTFESGNFVITEGSGGIFNLEQKQSYDQLIAYEKKVTTGLKSITVSGIKTVEYFDTDGPSTSAPTIVLTDTKKNVYLISMAIPAESNSNLFDQIISTFKFTSQATDPNQQAITNLVNSFYTALANQDGKTLFSLMTPATTTAEKSDYNWLTGADLGVTPTYRVFIRSKINNQKITNIQKQTDESYLVSITDQSYGYSNAGSVVGFTSPEPRNNIYMTVINIGSQWLIDKYTDQNYQGNPGSAPSLKYNGFGQ